MKRDSKLIIYFVFVCLFLWIKDGLSKTEALRQAKLKVINSKIKLKAVNFEQPLFSPFYWAPFILFGEGS